MQNGTPTHTYSVLRGGKCENIAIVEVQAPGVVKAIVTMIGKLFHLLSLNIC